MNNSPHNLYIHVPFCASKCNYCAFYSTACANPDWGGFCDGVLGEINYWGATLGKITVPTIFFGGGTPSLMPTSVFSKIINAIHQNFDIPPNCEVTMESNPGTIDAQQLAEFQKAGVNRLSVGVQSLDDDELNFLGRRHNAKQAIDLINTSATLGLRTSADFIYGLPGQSVYDIQNMCERINNLGIGHCSMYELSIEPGTPFATMNLDMPDNETMAEMYDAIGRTLNLARYEVSNYSTPGHECRHNSNIWDGAGYIGIGRGAAGRVLIDGIWYEQRGNNETFIPITIRNRAIEKIITGLRTRRGVRLTDDTENIIDWEYVNQNTDLLMVTGDRMSATQKGILILNDLLVKLIK